MTTFVSTAIPYVNARPHIGFALELIQADVITRWHRLNESDTFFLTGTDENALKNVQVAKQLGITPQELCDNNAIIFQNLTQALHLSNNRFIRTSELAHHQGVTQFWQACKKSDIYLKTYQGLYCLGCEDFLLEKDMVNGQCPDHGIRPELVEEQNYFFRLSAYQQILDDLISSNTIKIFPRSRRNEALGFIRQKLQDFSISRPVSRTEGWGVPVPGDPSQTVYVWFDALVNYLTGSGYPTDQNAFDHRWLKAHKIHAIGKNVLKFHAIYWPALLLSAGLPLPDELVVHGFLTINGQKISKSTGNAIDPLPLIQKYGTDAVRYYLLRVIPSGSDGDFSETTFHERYTVDLSNGLGNLVHRLATLCERASFGLATPEKPILFPEVAQALESYQFHEALKYIWNHIRELNQQIEITRPWDLLKLPDSQILHHHLLQWTNHLRHIASNLFPFLPETSCAILAQLDEPAIKSQNPLFPRL